MGAIHEIGRTCTVLQIINVYMLHQLANCDSITCDLISLLWPILRCNLKIRFAVILAV